MRVVIACGGTVSPPHERWHTALRTAERVIAADGGLALCRQVDRLPDLVVGDLDSADSGDLQWASSSAVGVVELDTDKDQTDLEVALVRATADGANHITVVGLLGGRADHALANVALVASPRWHRAGVTIDAVDGGRRLWVVHDAVDLREGIGTTMTLLPWGGDAIGVTVTGLRWPLDAAHMVLGTTWGVSNEVVDAVQSVTVNDGTIVVIADETSA